MSSPLFVQAESLRLLNDRSGSLSALQVHSELCQLESLQGVNHSFEVWSVNEHAVLVGDVGDDNLLAVVSPEVDKGNTAALNEIVFSWLHTNVTDTLAHVRELPSTRRFVRALTISSSI